MKRSRPNCAAHLGREARSETQRPAPWRREAFGFHIEADGSLTEHEGEQAVIRKAQCGGAGSAPADELKTHFIRKGPASEGQRCEGEGRVMARGLDRRVARTGASVTEISESLSFQQHLQQETCSSPTRWSALGLKRWFWPSSQQAIYLI